METRESAIEREKVANAEWRGAVKEGLRVIGERLGVISVNITALDDRLRKVELTCTINDKDLTEMRQLYDNFKQDLDKLTKELGETRTALTEAKEGQSTKLSGKEKVTLYAALLTSIALIVVEVISHLPHL